MEQTEWMIGLVTSFVVLVAVLKSRANMVFRFLVQAVLGGILIYGMNQFFLSQNIVSIIALKKGLDKQEKNSYNRNYFKSPFGLQSISGDF